MSIKVVPIFTLIDPETKDELILTEDEALEVYQQLSKYFGDREPSSDSEMEKVVKHYLSDPIPPLPRDLIIGPGDRPITNDPILPELPEPLTWPDTSTDQDRSKNYLRE